MSKHATVKHTFTCPNEECEADMELTFYLEGGYPATHEEPGCPDTCDLESEPECPTCGRQFTQKEEEGFEETVLCQDYSDDPRCEPEYWEQEYYEGDR